VSLRRTSFAGRVSAELDVEVSDAVRLAVAGVDDDALASSGRDGDRAMLTVVR
jgi:hypothetical protein